LVVTGMELRELRFFVAAAEEGGLSAAARRLHLSQSALSQAMQGLERQLGVELLVRTTRGIQLTDAGSVLLREARDLLAHHDRAVAAVVPGSRVGGSLRVGVPLELPPELLTGAVAQLGDLMPEVTVHLLHMSTAEQVSALREGSLDVAFVRECLPTEAYDALLVVEEKLGVLLRTEVATELAEDGNVRLEKLGALRWVAFNRAEAPAWYDQVRAILRSHGVVDEDLSGRDSPLISEVKYAAVQSGQAFTLAPAGSAQPVLPGVVWCSLVGSPLIRRTWAVWRAQSRRRDIGALIAALEPVQR
jgi:DNA-binding transcriptional LysR family regulator